MYLTEEQIDALHFTWPDRWIIVRDEDGFCTFAGDIPSDEEVAEAEKSEVYVKYLTREKIDALEAEITSRRVRDALSGSQDAQRWLDNQEAKIDAERAKLTAGGTGAGADANVGASSVVDTGPEASARAGTGADKAAGKSADERAAPPSPDDTAAGLPRNSLDAAVRILLMAVYSDGKRTPGEMDEMERQASIVGGVVTYSGAAPLRSVTQVVDEQILDVRAAMDGPQRTAEIDRALRAIDDRDVIGKLCEALGEIARADGELQQSEHQFLAGAMKAWGIEEVPGV